MSGERVSEVVTRRCWKCDLEFEIDRHLQERVTESLIYSRGQGKVKYSAPLLRLPKLFYYLCEKCREEKYDYKDAYDALAFRIVEARSLKRPEKAFTLEDLRKLGFTKHDLALIRVMMKKYNPKG